MPLNVAPIIITFTIEALISLSRMNDLFNESDLVPVPRFNDYEVPIKFNHCDFEWEVAPAKLDKKKRRLGKKVKPEETIQIEMKEKSEPAESTIVSIPSQEEPSKSKVGCLTDIDFVVKKGSLTCIVGSVGSGKSSILAGMLGEMKHVSGSVEISGSIAYCSQSAWIMNDTVKGNIIFGKPYDEKKYQETIKYAALARDFEILPAGDMTEIGESLQIL